MKSINKKLYTALAVCLLSLLLTVGVMAETSSSVANTSSTGSAPVSSAVDENSSSTESGDGSNTESDDETGSNESNSSDLTSGEGDNSSNSSLISSTVSNVSSKKPNINIGGYIDDETDTSGWGTGDDELSEPLVSVGTTEKGESKQISNYGTLLWVLIWIPVLLIIASVAALVYVNRKAFLTEGAPAEMGETAKKQNAKKARKKRTNVYKPRD